MKREIGLIVLGFALGVALMLAMWNASDRYLIDKYERMLDSYIQDIAEEC